MSLVAATCEENAGALAQHIHDQMQARMDDLVRPGMPVTA